jgi:hypothetical protein
MLSLESSQPFSPSLNVPLSIDPWPQPMGIPYWYSPFSWVSLPLFLLIIISVTAVPPQVLLTSILVSFHWYNHLLSLSYYWRHFKVLLIFLFALDYKDVPLCGLTNVICILFSAPLVCVCHYLPPYVAFLSLSSLMQVLPALPAFHSFDHHPIHIHNYLSWYYRGRKSLSAGQGGGKAARRRPR